MALDISWPAVAVAIAIGLAIAWVWYSDWGLVGGTWRGLTGVTKADSERAGKLPFVILVVSVVATGIALAAVDALASAALDVESVWIALAVGLVTWGGFSLSTLTQHNGFEQKPARLTIINSAYQLVLFVGMALCIGLIP